MFLEFAQLLCEEIAFFVVFLGPAQTVLELQPLSVWQAAFASLV
jgi:hypothetical protein